MAAAISQVFPTSRHRLCIWHSGENSKKHIKTLRNNKDFLDMFIIGEAEFEIYWTRMVTGYKCHKNPWLEKLYDCREKWCPAFNKDYFSGGILSSQMSETTNHSISRRLSKTAGLCDFYSSFVSVISKWRSKENSEDFRYAQIVPAMMMEHVKLLSYDRESKKVVDGRNVDIVSMFYNVSIPPSIWVVEISRKFQRLIVSSQENSVARQFCDYAVEDAKKNVEDEIGYVHTEEFDVV
ncbi:PREDICTED: protein FAR-RED IMPAIRED RESPONSE 1-like [Ipomoea nil]|uniref:protein FAR-RED IMPAIRED RESPONSE 1-like n=1 Tax=Ipomoea nil TaxID=35883 RepID=UPI000900A328|nr:PREDICTED: protein FAR-RED IMPAIRED RESPONSE 1-like [Ipomoea nil]